MIGKALYSGNLSKTILSMKEENQKLMRIRLIANFITKNPETNKPIVDKCKIDVRNYMGKHIYIYIYLSNIRIFL